MTDESIMPFGKFKGMKMANIDASYLIWLFENGKCYGEVKAYITQNISVLKEEVKRQKK